MKIGILTLPLHTNYGGILQAYALQTVLERMGHEVVVINRNFHLKKYPPLWRFPLSLTKRCIRKYLFRQNVDIFSEYHQNKTYKTISQYTQRFINQHIHTLTINELEELNKKDFDCIVVGSDQVWRKKYFTYHYATTIDNAYLAFANKWKVKKIAYAASFGTEDWEYSVEDTNKCKKLISLFDNVSVREKDGLKLCKEKFNMNVVQSLDPTLLLNQSDYLTLLDADKSTHRKGNLFTYILDMTPEKDALVSFFSEKMGYVPFEVTDINKDVKSGIRIIPKVEKWIRCFYDAEVIFTDSFHACVFSIIFRKQFYVYGNVDRGLSRFSSLFEVLGVGDRFVLNSTDITRMKPIDYDTVYQYLGELRNESFEYLNRSLN